MSSLTEPWYKDAIDASDMRCAAAQELLSAGVLSGLSAQVLLDGLPLHGALYTLPCKP